MDRRIELIGSGEDVGIKDNNKLDFYPREDLSVSSTEESVIVIKDTRNGVEVLRANTTDFISPEEASVKDLIILIKNIIDIIPVLELSVDEVAAIKGSDNPSGTNTFETQSQLDDRDVANRNRSNHTGTQLASTISDFAANVLAAVLTGFSVGAASTILDTDSVLQAFGKSQGQINNIITILSGKQNVSEKGIANGYASLDSNGLHPISERPDIFQTAIESSKIITPPTLTANANDYSPTGYGTANVLRQDIDANNRAITGIEAPTSGVNRIIGICNINTAGFDIRLQHEDANSLPENRFLLRDDGARQLKPNETGFFWYDHTSSRWRPWSRIG